MKNANYSEYRQLLLRAGESARECVAQERPAIHIETHGDAIDNLTEALNREQSITASMHAAGILRSVQAALARMEDGTFGACVQCGKAISPKRLAAIPWAANCLSCQEQIDEQTEKQECPSVRLFAI